MATGDQPVALSPDPSGSSYSFGYNLDGLGNCEARPDTWTCYAEDYMARLTRAASGEVSILICYTPFTMTTGCLATQPTCPTGEQPFDASNCEQPTTTIVGERD